MKKIVIAIVIIALLALGAFFLLRPGPATPALLYLDGSDVSVNTGNGWVPATDEMELRAGSAIKTGSDTATVVLMEGELVLLEPNTEITLEHISKKAIRISQQAGETLNKITKLSGVQSYTVESPSTVATVRGTTFFYSDEEVTVEDGTVSYGPKSEPNKLSVGAGKKARKGSYSLIDIAEQDRAKFEQRRARQLRALERVREREIRKHQTILSFAEKRGLTPEKRQQKLAEIDTNPSPTEDDAYNQAPGFLKPKAERTYRLTKEIKKVRAARQAGTLQTRTPAGGTTAPLQNNCAVPSGCRTYDSECGGKGSERLFIDGVYQKCVDATKAATEGIDYCGRTIRAQGDRTCSYMTNDYQERSRCLCPSHA
ncbi:hypothetical protein C4580_05045 [Candidatus Woesearchaeota archaeon]|nr:MAG: hypothetical protein C4580_05045 [Candidatus Woesearchaeota archaeon]